MDSFDIDYVKIEKANAMLKYRRFRKIAKFFRFVEICVALILLSWISARLPIAVRISGKYVRELCVVVLNPRFVFLVGNAIIITLFAKSGRFCGQRSDLCDDLVKNSHNRQKLRTDSSTTLAQEPEEIVCQDKQTVHEEYMDCPKTTFKAPAPAPKIYRRSQSENLKLRMREKPRHELRRSETEKCSKITSSSEKPVEKSYLKPEEDLNSEEFRRRIEAFIKEEQQRFQREESLAIVLPN